MHSVTAVPELRNERPGFFLSSDGALIHYHSTGPKDAPPVVFCYGLACSGAHFKYQWQHLAKEHQLFMLNYRGHYDSQRPNPTAVLTLERIARDIAELMDHVKTREAPVVIGHSMGVNVALEYFALFPSEVRALILIAGGAAYPVKDRKQLGRLKAIHSVIQFLDGAFPKVAEKFWQNQKDSWLSEKAATWSGFNPKLARREDIRQCIEMLCELPPHIFVQLLGDYLRHDRRKILGKIEVPTLVIAGEKDRMVPFHFQKELHRKIPKSELFIVQDGSHCPQLDRPELVNDAIGKFLDTLSKGRLVSAAG